MRVFSVLDARALPSCVDVWETTDPEKKQEKAFSASSDQTDCRIDRHALRHFMKDLVREDDRERLHTLCAYRCRERQASRHVTKCVDLPQLGCISFSRVEALRFESLYVCGMGCLDGLEYKCRPHWRCGYPQHWVEDHAHKYISNLFTFYIF